MAMKGLRSMKIDTFLTLYKTKRTDEAREAFLRERVKGGYIPIAKKREYAEEIVAASFLPDGGVDSFGRYIATNLTMVRAFTDIEIPEDNGAVPEAFDKLNEVGVFYSIVEFADPREMEEFQMVVEFVTKDTLMNMNK